MFVQRNGIMMEHNMYTYLSSEGSRRLLFSAKKVIKSKYLFIEQLTQVLILKSKVLISL